MQHAFGSSAGQGTDGTNMPPDCINIPKEAIIQDSVTGHGEVSSISAAEFAALPVAQLQRILDIPDAQVSVHKLKRLVGQRVQVRFGSAVYK